MEKKKREYKKKSDYKRKKTRTNNSRKEVSLNDLLKKKGLVALRAEDFYKMQDALKAYQEEDVEVKKQVDAQLAQQIQEEQDRLFVLGACPYCSRVIYIPREIQVEGGNI